MIAVGRLRSAKGCAAAGLAVALASCGGNEKAEPHAASGGSGGAMAATGGARAETGGAAGNSGGAQALTGGVPAVATGGTPAVGTGGVPPVGTGGSASDIDGGDCPCCGAAIAEVQAGTTCSVDVYATRLTMTSYEYAALEEKLASLPQDIALSVTQADLLRAEAEPPPSKKMTLVLTPEAAARFETTKYGDPFEQVPDLFMHPFQLSCGGKRLFIGIVYAAVGAAAIEVPVLHLIKREDGSMVLALGAWQGAWMGFPLTGEPGAKERIDRPELRASFCQKGTMSQLD